VLANTANLPQMIVNLACKLAVRYLPAITVPMVFDHAIGRPSEPASQAVVNDLDDGCD
jgi:hypothetical protein